MKRFYLSLLTCALFAVAAGCGDDSTDNKDVEQNNTDGGNDNVGGDDNTGNGGDDNTSNGGDDNTGNGGDDNTGNGGDDNTGNGDDDDDYENKTDPYYCDNKEDGAYCTTVDSHEVAYVCSDHTLQTSGSIAPRVCEDQGLHCLAVDAKLSPTCVQCTRDEHCENGICNDENKCEISNSICTGVADNTKLCADDSTLVTCSGEKIADNGTQHCTQLYGGFICMTDDPNTGAHCGCYTDNDCPENAPYCNVLSTGYHICMATQMNKPDDDGEQGNCSNGFVEKDSLCCIHFADNEVKKYALSNWDSNSDGCVTATEADSVEAVPDSAFKSNKNLKSLTDFVHFHNIKTIGKSAFHGSGATGSFSFASVESVAAQGFYQLSDITEIDMPSLKNTDSGAFYGCTGLTKVNFPSLETVGNSFLNAGTKATIPLTKLSLPAATSLGNSILSKLSGIEVIELTAEGEINTSEATFKDFDTSAVELVLNNDKKAGGTGSPLANGNSWAGVTWKSITFAD